MKANVEEEIRCVTVELRSIDGLNGSAPVIEGHAAVFNQRSHDMGFREVIAPGAFSYSIQNHDIKFLLNHRGLAIARTKSGTLKLSEDSRGLAFHADLDSTDPDVLSLMPKVRRGDVNEMSFGFAIEDRTEDEEWRVEKGQMIRTLRKVRLYEISAVSEPAYPGTNLNARSYFAAKMAELSAEAPEKITSSTREERERIINRAEHLMSRSKKEFIYELKRS